MKTFIALILFLFAVPSQADWKSKTMDVLLFATGVIVSYAVHEAAHELTARAYGEKIDWTSGHWSCRKPCDNHDSVAIAGNISTAILGESLLYLPVKYKYSPFVDGMQTLNTINPIVYLYLDGRNKNGYGDYQYLEKKMDNVTAALSVHAATIGYRQFSDRAWKLFFTQRSVTIAVNF